MLALKREAMPNAEFVFVNPKTDKPYTDIKKAFAKACNKAKIMKFAAACCGVSEEVELFLV
jgi:hypothetical protein